MPKILECEDSEIYDFIVVGSGNGACAFLRQYLACNSEGKFLVLEEGEDFFETSEITHQRNWTESYSQKNIFKLHTAQTPNEIPIISGRACTMGGGGSINYTMIFESSDWLTKNLGHDRAYWDARKKELAESFQLQKPQNNLTAVAIHVQEQLKAQGFSLNEEQNGYIPVYVEGKDQQIHIFPTQFNEFGQRTHSGVSLLNWHENERLDYMTQQQVTQLFLEDGDNGQRCTKITVLNLITGKSKTYQLGANAKLLLCAGAGTPKLLYEHREKLNNFEIGKHVNDHILLPFGIYLLKKDLQVTLKDQYVSLFATTEVFSEENSEDDPKVCNFDFFSGELDVLLYLVSHLFLAFWVPNWLKFWMIRNSQVFQYLKQTSRSLVRTFNFLDDILWSISNPSKIGKHKWNLISAIVKFNIAREGYYKPLPQANIFERRKQNVYEIILRCFDDQDLFLENNPDFKVAATAISQQIPLMNQLGKKPHPIFQFLIRLFTRMPYYPCQVQNYISHYSRNNLLTEQHLSGGCVFGKAINLGLELPQNTGKVLGSQNIYVARGNASKSPKASR